MSDQFFKFPGHYSQVQIIRPFYNDAFYAQDNGATNDISVCFDIAETDKNVNSYQIILSLSFPKLNTF